LQAEGNRWRTAVARESVDAAEAAAIATFVSRFVSNVGLDIGVFARLRVSGMLHIPEPGHCRAGEIYGA
jgi:hypothetical protein